MAKRITASDSSSIKIGGVTFGIPKGTEINIAVGGSKGRQVNTGSIQDGDGTSYPVKGITQRGLFGVVVHPQDQESFDFFNEELFSASKLPVVLMHGDESWTFTGFAVASDEKKSPTLKSSSEASEAFDIISTGDRIR